jgi:hypothetical protein
MNHRKALFAMMLPLASLTVGAGTHYFIFSYAFFSSPVAWLLILLRVALAFVAGHLWRRAGLASLLLALIYLGIESGPVTMALWAGFNFAETGRIGFDLSYWIIPAAADFVALWIGAGLRRRYRPLA